VTKDEFCALPAPLALGVLFDIAHAKLENIPAPPIPRSPKYDGKLTRKKGEFCWLSEMTIEDLEWWCNKKRESAAAGGQYADADAKAVGRLEQWIQWRRLFPYAIWSGKRGDDMASAAPPSRSPQLHKWGPRQAQGAGPTETQTEKPPENEYGF
jgi:hypothetical protein